MRGGVAVRGGVAQGGVVRAWDDAAGWGTKLRGTGDRGRAAKAEPGRAAGRVLRRESGRAETCGADMSNGAFRVSGRKRPPTSELCAVACAETRGGVLSLFETDVFNPETEAAPPGVVLRKRDAELLLSVASPGELTLHSSVPAADPREQRRGTERGARLIWRVGALFA